MSNKILGGANLPVEVVTTAPDSKVAVPVYGFTTLDRPLLGGPRYQVYIVSQAQIDSGEYELMPGPAQPVYEIDSRDLAQGVVPVYVIGGTLGSSGYDGDAETYWGEYESQLTDGRKALDSQFFTDLKSAGLFAKFDCFWIFAHEVKLLAYRNLIKRAHDCTDGVAPTWTQNRGIQGNGTTQYVFANYLPNTHKVNLSLNSGTILAYNRTNTSANVFDMGSQAGANLNRLDLIVRLAGGTTGGSVNENVGGAFASASPLGLIAVSRTANNVAVPYRNGSALGTNVNSSTAINDVNVTICARNSNGTPGTFSARQFALAAIGAGLSAGEHLTLYNLVQAYLAAIGASV